MPPVMMINVIGRAMSAISAASRPWLSRFSGSRNSSDRSDMKIMPTTKMTNRIVSWRSSRPRSRPDEAVVAAAPGLRRSSQPGLESFLATATGDVGEHRDEDEHAENRLHPERRDIDEHERRADSGIRIAASVEPMTVPTPPRMETPPTTEAVMTWSSRPGVTTAWIVLNCVANMTLATPVNSPLDENVVNTIRFVSRPERRALPRHCRRPRTVDRPVRLYRIHRNGHDGQHGHEPDRQRDAEQALHREPVAGRQVVERVAAGDENEAAFEDAEHSEGGNDGGDAQMGDEEPVDGADEHADRGSAPPRREVDQGQRRPVSSSPRATYPESVTSTPIAEPTEMSMLPVMMTIDMPIAATAM